MARVGTMMRPDDGELHYPAPPQQEEQQPAPTPPPAPPPQPPSQQALPDFKSQYGFDVDESARASYEQGRSSYDEVLRDMQRRAGSQRTGGAPAPPPANISSGLSGAYQGVFSDPLTKQYEQLLQAQLGLYQQQQAQMQQAAQAAAQRRAATAQAVQRLTDYTTQRVGKLQGPAYTGTEQEVLRTQYLDPLERDRTAAQQRALQQISMRGMDPSSGIAQQLLLDVNRAFDEQRTRGQGTIASRQIEEQRSREQEAQQLLQYLAMLPDATARGDLDFVSYVQNLINQPGAQALSAGQMLSNIPTQRLNDALATLGVAPSMSGANTSAIQLMQQLQQQRLLQQQQQAQYWNQIGQSFFPG